MCYAIKHSGNCRHSCLHFEDRSANFDVTVSLGPVTVAPGSITAGSLAQNSLIAEFFSGLYHPSTHRRLSATRGAERQPLLCRSIKGPPQQSCRYFLLFSVFLSLWKGASNVRAALCSPSQSEQSGPWPQTHYTGIFQFWRQFEFFR